MEIGSGVRIGPFEVFAPLQPAVSIVHNYGEHHFPGRLIVVDGIDGCGKSTQLSLLHKWLESKGYAVVFSEWNSSPLVKDTTKHGKKKKLLTPATFSLIHSTDFADAESWSSVPLRPLHLYRLRPRCGPRHGPGLGARSLRIRRETRHCFLFSCSPGDRHQPPARRPRWLQILRSRHGSESGGRFRRKFSPFPGPHFVGIRKNDSGIRAHRRGRDTPHRSPTSASAPNRESTLG